MRKALVSMLVAIALALPAPLYSETGNEAETKTENETSPPVPPITWRQWVRKRCQISLRTLFVGTTVTAALAAYYGWEAGQKRGELAAYHDFPVDVQTTRKMYEESEKDRVARKRYIDSYAKYLANYSHQKYWEVGAQQLPALLSERYPDIQKQLKDVPFGDADKLAEYIGKQSKTKPEKDPLLNPVLRWRRRNLEDGLRKLFSNWERDSLFSKDGVRAMTVEDIFMLMVTGNAFDRQTSEIYVGGSGVRFVESQGRLRMQSNFASTDRTVDGNRGIAPYIRHQLSDPDAQLARYFSQPGVTALLKKTEDSKNLVTRGFEKLSPDAKERLLSHIAIFGCSPDSPTRNFDAPLDPVYMECFKGYVARTKSAPVHQGTDIFDFKKESEFVPLKPLLDGFVDEIKKVSEKK